jgi:hypothetical protein
MGKALDAEFIRELGRRTGLDLQLWVVDAPDLPAQVNARLKRGGAGSLVTIADSETAADAYRMVEAWMVSRSHHRRGASRNDAVGKPPALCAGCLSGGLLILSSVHFCAIVNAQVSLVSFGHSERRAIST